MTLLTVARCYLVDAAQQPLALLGGDGDTVDVLAMQVRDLGRVSG